MKLRKASSQELPAFDWPMPGPPQTSPPTRNSALTDMLVLGVRLWGKLELQLQLSWTATGRRTVLLVATAQKYDSANIT